MRRETQINLVKEKQLVINEFAILQQLQRLEDPSKLVNVLICSVYVLIAESTETSVFEIQPLMIP